VAESRTPAATPDPSGASDCLGAPATPNPPGTSATPNPPGASATPDEPGAPVTPDRAGAPATGAFDRDTAVALERRSDSEAAFSAEVSSGWRAGRGPHGGYLAALLLRALTEGLAQTTAGRSSGTPRSLTIHYLRAPDPGPVQIGVTLERAGRSLSTLSARMERDGTPLALALAAFSVPWSAPEIADLPLPDVAPPDATREAGSMRKYGAPPFTEHVVLQPRIGALPFSGSEGPMEVGGWLGLAEPRPIDALSLAFFSDALFSPPFVRLREPATSPTVDLTVHFRTSMPLPGAGAAEELCFARFRSGVLHEGFFEEDGVIWAQDGTVLAQSRQLAIMLPLPRR
jgi:acyl-CoA thioesterase